MKITISTILWRDFKKEIEMIIYDLYRLNRLNMKSKLRRKIVLKCIMAKKTLKVSSKSKKKRTKAMLPKKK